jgi:hypothetical protein
MLFIQSQYLQRSCPTAKLFETIAQAFQAWAVLLNRFAVRGICGPALTRC